MRNIFTLFLSFLFLSTSAQDADKTVTLTVTGQGKTIDEAKTNALRSAIEQAFGAFISSNTIILNDKLVRDEIVSVTNGNIQKFEILSENVLPNGIQSVLLNATVSISKLTSFSQAKGIKIEFEGGLFAVNIKQKILNEDAEVRSIWNTLFTLNPILRKAFDYKISNKEPTSENGNSTFNLELRVETYTNNNIDLIFSYLKNVLSKISLNSEQENEYIKLKKPIYPVKIDDKYYIFRKVESQLAIKYFFDDIPSIQRGFVIEDGISQTVGSKYYFNFAVNKSTLGESYWGDYKKSFLVNPSKMLKDIDIKEDYFVNDLVSGFEYINAVTEGFLPNGYVKYNEIIVKGYISKTSNTKVKTYTLRNKYTLAEIEKS